MLNLCSKCWVLSREPCLVSSGLSGILRSMFGSHVDKFPKFPVLNSNISFKANILDLNSGLIHDPNPRFKDEWVLLFFYFNLFRFWTLLLTEDCRPLKKLEPVCLCGRVFLSHTPCTVMCVRSPGIVRRLVSGLSLGLRKGQLLESRTSRKLRWFEIWDIRASAGLKR